MSSNEVKFINVMELSKIFNISPNTIYYLVSRKKIPHFKIGKHIRFDYQTVLSQLQSRPSNFVN